MATIGSNRQPSPEDDSLSLSSQMLSDCWLAALGSRPSGPHDTLDHHEVSPQQKRSLVDAICQSFCCPLDPALFPEAMPFHKTAELLKGLLPIDSSNREHNESTVWLAPGFGGLGVGELLLASCYRSAGNIRLVHYPALDQMSVAGDIVKVHVDAVVAQIGSARGQGRLILAGHSLGAHVMHAVACQLEQQQVAIELLLLINSVAVPTRKDLGNYHLKFAQCRRPYQFRLWLQWKLAREAPQAMRLANKFFSLLTAVGLRPTASRWRGAFSNILRLRAFSYTIEHTHYHGKAALIRPLAGGSSQEADGGWSRFCDQLITRSVSVPERDLLRGENRRLVAAAMLALVNQQTAGMERATHR